MLAAVRAGKNWKESNTEVGAGRASNGGVEVSVYLHGNLIYEQYQNLSGSCLRRFTLAGWNTTTTKSRLRALGVGVETKRGRVYYNGKEIDVSKWYEV